MGVVWMCPNKEINILEEVKKRNEIAQNFYGITEIEGVSVENYIKETITLALANNFHEEVATGYRLLGVHFTIKGVEKKALDSLEKSENYIKKHNLGERLYAQLYNAYIVYYGDAIGDEEKASHYCRLGIEKAEKIDDKDLLSRFKFNLAYLNIKLGRFEIALEILEKNLIYYESINDEHLLIYCLTNLAETYVGLNRIEQAKTTYERAYNAAVRMDEIAIIYDSSVGLSKLYANEGKYNRAIKMLNETIEMAHEKNIVRIYVDTKIQLISIYLQKGSFDKANELLEEVEEPMIQLENQSVELKFYELKAKVSEKLEKYKNAYFSAVKIQTLTQTLQKQNAEKNVNDIGKNQLMKTRERINTIAKIGRELTTFNIIDDVIAEVAHKLRKLMDIDYIGIGNINQSTIYYKHYSIEKDEVFKSDKPIDNANSIATWVINNNKVIMINDMEKEYVKYTHEIVTSKLKLNERYSQSMLCAPLSVKDEIIGVFNIQSYKKNAYCTEELEIFQIIASYIAIAQVNINQAERLKKLSIMDSLTGIYNRRGFVEGYAKLQNKKQMQLKSTAMLMLDLDYFKRLNDHYGHLAGDLVLEQVGGILSSNNKRVGGLTARLGGEEFGLVVLNQSQKDTIKLAETIRKEIEQLDTINEGKLIKVTVSIGIAYVKGVELPVFGEIYQKADEMLYQAKTTGRNKLEIFLQNI